MEDLLNEEEFIEKKSDYNPWRRFGVFYGIVVAIHLAYYVSYKLVPEVLLAIVILGTPLLATFIMVFSKKVIFYLPLWTIFQGIAGMMVTGYISVVFISIIDETDFFTLENLKMIIFLLGFYIALGLISFAIIFPIHRFKRKRLKQRP